MKTILLITMGLIFSLPASAVKADSLLDTSKSFEIARAFKMGDGTGIGLFNKGFGTDGYTPIAPKPDCAKNSDCPSDEKCVANKCLDICASSTCSGTTPLCSTNNNQQVCSCSPNSCEFGYRCDGSKCVETDKNADCVSYCGSGFKYERQGAMYNGKERVCIKYPLDCGMNCTTGWTTSYPNNLYTCQTAVQVEDKDADCVKYCGSGFSYDRPGALYNGQERVCTKYPLACGMSCTTGWDIRYANNPYTCQTARQTEDKNAECVRNCGSGFNYERQGGMYGGQERVCIKYPLACGYGCTTGWDTVYGNNMHTCQTARQTDPNACTGSPSAGGAGTYGPQCVQYCGSGYNFDRMGGMYSGQEKVCTKYPKPGGWSCTQYFNKTYNGQYTCQLAVMSDTKVR